MKTKQNIHAALTLACFAIPALILGLTARHFNGQSLLALILIAAGFWVVRRQLARQSAGHNSSLVTHITPYNVSDTRSIHEDHHERAHRDAAESQRRRTRAPLAGTDVRQTKPSRLSLDIQIEGEARTRALPKENLEVTT
ncbi:hypothetical protein [Arthrobacter sp. Rue61a]|uniref:hypothetical protein n=1 Tax=Arthrobacter sp. Rue61a TaxID=1118963 RepID=UPI000150AE77|nr:hypothetical protein [Arthrobacter sp. Rue61a]AFR34566.1 hypothetical protein ARUE_113p00580 [Arthrobacter sp. Rue61a]